MKRLAAASVIATVIAVALGVGLFMSGGRRAADPGSVPDVAEKDSVWYHASDVALLATTGRPQLVEFFHPD